MAADRTTTARNVTGVDAGSVRRMLSTATSTTPPARSDESGDKTAPGGAGALDGGFGEGLGRADPGDTAGGDTGGGPGAEQGRADCGEQREDADGALEGGGDGAQRR